MSNKLSFILISFFVTIILLFGVDLIMVNAIYTSLDSLSESVSFKISNYGITNEGKIDSSIKEFANSNYKATLVEQNGEKVDFRDGDIFTYIIYKEYNPLFISSEKVQISIKRYAVIGINKI